MMWIVAFEMFITGLLLGTIATQWFYDKYIVKPQSEFIDEVMADWKETLQMSAEMKDSYERELSELPKKSPYFQVL